MRCTLCRVMPHLPAIPATGNRLTDERAQHLPPGGGEADRPGQFLGEREELAIALEDS